jgi:hypothetical protein
VQPFVNRELAVSAPDARLMWGHQSGDVVPEPIGEPFEEDGAGEGGESEGSGGKMLAQGRGLSKVKAIGDIHPRDRARRAIFARERAPG